MDPITSSCPSRASAPFDMSSASGWAGPFGHVLKILFFVLLNYGCDPRISIRKTLFGSIAISDHVVPDDV